LTNDDGGHQALTLATTMAKAEPSPENPKKSSKLLRANFEKKVAKFYNKEKTT
jgi:hypothetical protein